ncbi:type IV pilus modification PilV family protein [Sulfitobacter aestuariivivens]|uniref:Prepilin-type N-terminal cleavage/methylation domain-containing protein n=1 Tax=Sulfitobacter aestuariivivens TaxID=2766981 RepID=A0A927D4E8_9RHOB|nr:prepilin-type N-terminal cleavage/methylation domain-containing protein [Sulfitobacter aestuariivivens]MBD3664938.1 prepilin-type N-terminal cleavage/methylation domain-containing protein [Sulfitobacter aestuariivivens]
MRRKVDGAPDSGMTLIELAVAILILALGTVATLRATDQSRLAIGGAEDRILAQLAARNRAEELQLLGVRGAATLPEVVTLAGQDVTLSTTTKQTEAGLTEATINARAQRGGGAVLVIYLARGSGF